MLNIPRFPGSSLQRRSWSSGEPAWVENGPETLLDRPEPQLVPGSRADAPTQTAELTKANGEQRNESRAPFGSLVELKKVEEVSVSSVRGLPAPTGGGLAKTRRGDICKRAEEPKKGPFIRTLLRKHPLY